MKQIFNKSLLLNMSVILGISLSLMTMNVYAAPEEESASKEQVDVKKDTAQAAVEMKETTEAKTSDDVSTAEETASKDVAPEAAKQEDAKETIKESSEVASATPPIHDFNFKGVHSLRNGVALDGANDAAEIKLLPADSMPIARNYFQQPPLIPHRIREYKITVRNNKCMSCHSWSNYKQARATKVSQTHFEDRDGNAQSTLAARRYFCNQCHVPQVDAKPLVENGFKPVNELNK